ncbi:pleckstrin homology domain-containing family O member 1b isoform X2 [Corythoichthys intestinalis]|uniref:pleckstrin homology domain-containing family O member 1b isoform X2 n=1 Tax=Corythoichthys intestinalis TaxID=161448 RepID=UPI0025A62548|nr:pleckstrin homology domain-containing family O member 1b isoform X2 [Corythoichthys intestinalis]
MKKNRTCDARTEPEWADKGDKAGWLRRFCGKGLFREIWRNRFVVLKEQQLMLCEKEGHGAREVLDLSHFHSCDDVKNPKKKSRSKKDHSKFTLQKCRSAHDKVVNIMFLAVSPEDKESWINVLNGAITKAKNKILDQVTTDEAQLHHPTRGRARIRHGRRPPSRGHLLAVASSPDGTVTLDLIQEEYPALEETLPASERPPSASDGTLFGGSARASGKSRSLPRDGAAAASDLGKEEGKSQKNRCASMDEICGRSDEASSPAGRLRRLVGVETARTERLLAAARESGGGTRTAEEMRAEASGLLKEALEVLEQARRVLREVQQFRELHRQTEREGENSPS